MLIVAGEFVVAAGALDRVRGALHTMEEATRKEPGCLTYAFAVDVNDSSVVRIFERWESMEALAAHFKTAHMAAFGRAIGEIQPKSAEVKLYEVAKELPLPR